MKHVKMLGLAAVAALTLTALFGAGSASATVLCTENTIPCPVGEDYEFNTAIDATLESGTSSVIRSTGGTVLNTCTGSTIKGRTENTGGEGISVKVEMTELTFGECTNKTVSTALGRLTIEYVKGSATRGTLTAKGTQVTVFPGGVSCFYGAAEAGTHAGTLTGTTMTAVGVIHGKATLNEQVEDKLLCPNDVIWEAKYTITDPTQLYFKEKTG